MSHDADSIEARNKEIIRGARSQKQIPRGERDDNRRGAAEISIGCPSSFAFSELR